MLSFLVTLFFTALLMWAFFKFMYPKPPKAFMPQQGDIVTPRDCDFCGYPLAQYRGVLEEKPQTALTPTQLDTLKHYQAQQQAAAGAVNASGNGNNDNGNSGNGNGNGNNNGAAEHHPTQALVDAKTLSRQQRKARQHAVAQQQQADAEQRRAIEKMTTWFFCNYEHQAQFHHQNQAKNQTSRQASNQTNDQLAN